MKYLFMLLFLLFMATAAYSQKMPGNNHSEIPSSRDPEIKRKPEQAKVKKGKKNQGNSITVYYDVKVQEFHKRMEANAKKYKKMQKEMQNPQYSDPLYFGHKKMPKKRAPGKKKFCRECGMRH